MLNNSDNKLSTRLDINITNAIIEIEDFCNTSAKNPAKLENNATVSKAYRMGETN